MRLSADGIGTVNGKVYVGTAEKIPSSELIDTTGAGDAFIGAILYGKLVHRKKFPSLHAPAFSSAPKVHLKSFCIYYYYFSNFN